MRRIRQQSAISQPASHPPCDHNSIQPSAAFPQRRLITVDLGQRQRATMWKWTTLATDVFHKLARSYVGYGAGCLLEDGCVGTV